MTGSSSSTESLAPVGGGLMSGDAELEDGRARLRRWNSSEAWLSEGGRVRSAMEPWSQETKAEAGSGAFCGPGTEAAELRRGREERGVIEPLERYRTSSILSGPEVGARLVCVKHKSKSPGVFEADRAISYCALAVLAIGVGDEEETQQ
ncbi:hypothetical protein AXG93_1474s1200 [Marchantia polymorpha subsp. ruderalis]|uniref:Uncharacterized protein n=1 Tax=Marchantia polymorpha subsp. ruderalis TaxID=1480154 RepID=A0A176WAS7_MARPO|nr:hypothetical protein AXG93_1474s1200 [Marchantia polymorpha subsp. ruderalis]